jgi:hypothetical protein
MSDTFDTPFVIAPLAPLALAPPPTLESLPENSIRISPVSSDWLGTRHDHGVKVRAERRSAIVRAREKVESGWSRPTGPLTKRERLAATNLKGTSTTGSPEERRSVLSSVQKAAALVNEIPSDKEIGDSEYRMNRDALRQRYPGRSLSDMILTAEQTEAAFKDDPVAARSAIIARYALLPHENLPKYRAPVYDASPRGSMQRARQDQADAEELRAAESKYGKHLPQILAQLEAFDRGMINDPSNTSARLACAYGAPATYEQIPAYKAQQAVKQQAAALEQRHDNIHRGVQEAIKAGHIPGDEATLSEIAAVLQDNRFQHSPNGFDTLKRAAAIATHPDHVRLTGKIAAKRNDAGTKSISGSPGSFHDSTRSSIRPSSGIRDSIRRAAAR